MNHTEEKTSCWFINDDFLDSDAPIFEMSEEKKTYRKKDMECHHRYLCSYSAPRLDTIRNNKRKQLLFHDLSTWSATDSIWFSAIAAYILAFQNPSIELLFDKTAWEKQWIEGRGQMKAAFKLKKRNKGQGARFSRQFSSSSRPRCFEQARLTQKTKTNKLSEQEHGIAGCLDLSTAKIRAAVAGRQFQPECYCYRDRTATCCVWTWNRTGVVRS